VRAALLASILLALLSGCGSPWRSVPVGSLEPGATELGSSQARITLRDGRVIELRVLRMEYPYLWGERMLGERVPPREMRLDLEKVAKLEVRRS
jgi:hypothetical protein